MLVRILLAVCGLVGVVVSEKAASVSSVYCFQFESLCDHQCMSAGGYGVCYVGNVFNAVCYVCV